jgi:hypothetical protein
MRELHIFSGRIGMQPLDFKRFKSLAGHLAELSKFKRGHDYKKSLVH